MRKGQHLCDINAIHPIKFVPMNPINIPEVFVDITDQIVPGVLPYYMISNYGRIWHKYELAFLSVNIDSKGYIYKPLVTIEGPKNYRIHRLVMMSFNYFPGCENHPVDFIDQNKANPCIWNLKWGHEESTIIPSTEENIRLACSLLEDTNNTLPYISEVTGLTYGVIQAIQNKRAWTEISKDYDIKERKVASNFSEEQIRTLCEYYQSVPKNDILDKYCSTAIISALSIEDPNSKQIRAAKKIYTKDSYTNISKDYNF